MNSWECGGIFQQSGEFIHFQAHSFPEACAVEFVCNTFQVLIQLDHTVFSILELCVFKSQDSSVSIVTR